MKTTQFFNCLIIVLSLSTVACGGGNEAKSETQSEPQAIEPKSKWGYKEQVDQMDNTKANVAFISSENSLTFDFPYGESTFELYVRQTGKNQEVFLYCSKCQFLTGIAGSQQYRVKFDDETPFNVTVSGSSDGSADVAFLGSEKKLIEKLKVAKKVLIEPEFFQAGRKQLTFITEGFEWE